MATGATPTGDNPQQLNAAGVQALAAGDAARAAELFGRAIAADPRAPALWLNLAKAHREQGDSEGERAALDGALAIDARHLMALIRKAELQERLGEHAAAAITWSGAIAVAPPADQQPPALAELLAHAADFVAQQSAAFAEAIAGELDAARAAAGGTELRRFDAGVDAMLGRRRIYANECAGFHFPFLPADEFFARQHFDWMETLEAQTDAIRAELQDLLDKGDEGFAPYAHANGVNNPCAMFRKAIKLETYAKAEMVSEPINMFDMAPNADGAAAVILTRQELLPDDFSHPFVKIAGSAAASDTLALHDRKDMLFFDTAHISAGKAMKQAGIVLDRIDLFEYHDVFSIYGALQLEAVGFAIKGQGWKLAADGLIELKPGSGDPDSLRHIPCATMGGMKARGFAGGAAGVYQAVEAAMQLRGQAGANQVPDAKTALIQSLGGPASTAVSHILQRL